MSSNLSTEVFWDTIGEKYWAEFTAEYKLKFPDEPSPQLKEFMIWLDEHNLVPEPSDEF